MKGYLGLYEWAEGLTDAQPQIATASLNSFVCAARAKEGEHE